MITNIILGAILGAILVIFFILNNKINEIISDITLIKRDLTYIDKTNCNSNKLIYHLEDRFNDFILHYKSNNTITKDILTQINNCTNGIYDKVIRIKQAKISSKIKSQSKTNKSTNK